MCYNIFMYSEMDPSDIPQRERLRFRELIVPCFQIVAESLGGLAATAYSHSLPPSQRQQRIADIARLEAYANGEPLPPQADERS